MGQLPPRRGGERPLCKIGLPKEEQGAHTDVFLGSADASAKYMYIYKIEKMHRIVKDKNKVESVFVNMDICMA